MNNILNLLYFINRNGFILWLDGNEIKYSQYKNCVNKNEILSIARDNKKELIELLRINNLNQANNFNILNSNHFKYIYKSNYTKEVLSFGQERLIFIEKNEGGTYAYNMPMLFKLASSIDINMLSKSIKSIIDRHEVLRTVIREDNNGNSYQEVLDRKRVQDFVINKVISNSIEEFEKKLDEEVSYIFDLSNEYPIRVWIHEVDNKRYLSIVIHHIAFDGWSLDIFLTELFEFYKHYSSNQYPLPLIELPIQYKDYAIWQKNYLNGKRLEEQLKYWQSKLENYEELNLVTDKPRPNQIEYRGKYIHFELSKELSDKIRNICKKLDVSLYSVLLSGYYLLLRVYSNQNDIVIGTPVANRHYYQIADLIGLFINLLGLRVKINPDMIIEDFIKLVGNEIKEAQIYQDLPFEKLVSELKVNKDSSRHPIFQVLFSIENFGNSARENRRLEDISKLMEPYDTSIGIHKTAKFDISTFIYDSEDVLKGSFNYATSLYEEKTICKYIQTYIQILECIGEGVCNDYKYNKSKIKDIEYLGKEEYERIVYEWNKTDKEYDINRKITEAFEEWVTIQPDSIAVIYDEFRITYSELNKRANKLAHYLIDNYKLRGDELVALCLDRSENMLVAILGVLKAGGAYVPIDPSYPDERIRYILEDTESKVVIANGMYKQRLDNITKTPIIAIDDLTFWKQIFSYSSSTPKVSSTYRNLAYVIYTSGTTGNPKGVMIEHIAYTSTIKAAKDMYFNYSIALSTYSITNYVFDIFGLEYGLPLLSGGSVEIGTSNFRVLNCKDYNFIQITPSLCQIKIDSLNNLSCTKLLIGGEKLNEKLLKKLLFKQAKVVNVYGPTETTIWSSGKEYNELRDDNVSSIGLPFINEKAYVLDKNLNPVPLYAIGELYIGGIGVGRGYWNNAVFTAEKFVANPFISEEEYNDKKNLRIYKTGDIVRFIGNGEIEYIGRNDSQVKINGYRIELEEIGKAISSYPGISQAIAILKRNGKDKDISYVVGYYVSEVELDSEEIISDISNRLPQYMLPKTLVHLKSLPLNVNGKLDINKLPDPEFKDLDKYIAPRDDVESKIALIWSEILNIPVADIGIYHDFFTLGGNSILAIKLISILNREFHNLLKVVDIFIYRNISTLKSRILDKRDNKLIVKLNNLDD
jgi:amino acid adenylation domain-containing protein